MDPIRVVTALGIGDTHWGVQKMRALKELHPGRPLHVHINESNNHKTIGYLNAVKCIDFAVLDKQAPYDILKEMPPSYMSPHWSTLAGCKGWRGFDYILVPNGHLESGRHLSEYLPEIDTDYEIEYEFDIFTEQRVQSMIPEPRVLLYPSGTGPNNGFHGGWWTVHNWRWVVQCLNDAGISPLFIGANTPDDCGYFKTLEEHMKGLTYDSIVGQTSIPDLVLLIQRCKAWCGLNSGGGIVAASMKTPTVMMWSDENCTPGPHPGFVTEMQRGWLNEEQLETYRTFSYGGSDTNPRNVADAILEVMR